MRRMEGVLTIAQEGRFQLTNDHGISHLFILSHSAEAEPEQLSSLQQRQARVCVEYSRPRNLLALVAHSIVLAEASAQQGRVAH